MDLLRYSCTWTIVAEPGQHIVVSWRLSSVGSWRSGGTVELSGHGQHGQGHGNIIGGGPMIVHRKGAGSCPVTVAFIDGGGGGGIGQDSDINNGVRNTPISPTDTTSRDSSRYDDGDTAIHVTTCSIGSRDDARVIYASKTNRLQIRPTDSLISRLVPDNVDDVNWKPHLLEYQSRSYYTAYVGTGDHILVR